MYDTRVSRVLTPGCQVERKYKRYGVPKRLIDPIRNREFAEYMEKRSGFHRGQIDGILTEMVDAIRSLLAIGQPVTIEGLGTFHTSLTSPGFERPEQVTPGKVSVSRVYFVACPEFNRQVKKMKCTRIPFNLYMPESMLTKEMKKADREQELAEYNMEGSKMDEEVQE
ncbi:HU family DNA-binding protein [Bacteroides zhangwenhongii]|uniref:HU family DNA-binding protein n=1 Tax=Bacteroides zhangwenhongii TaxID=2650157 RepID=UPI003AB0FCF1